MDNQIIINKFAELRQHAAALRQNKPYASDDNAFDMLLRMTDELEELIAEHKLKQAADALDQSQAQLIRAQRVGHLGNWNWTMAQNTLDWSDEIYRIFGVDRNFELTYDNIEAMIHPDDREHNARYVQQLLTSEQNSVTFEFRIIRPDGEVRHINQITEIERDAQGSAERIFGVMQDITERKQTEDALRASEERYRHLLAAISDAVVVFDHNWRYLVANAAAVRRIGVPEADLLKTTLLDLFPEVQHTELFTVYQRVMETRQPDTTLHKQTFASGETDWYEVRVYPVPEGILVISRNITDRQRAFEELHDSEARFRGLVEASPDAILLIGPTSAIIMANEQAARLHGFENVQDMLANDIDAIDLVVAADRPRMVEYMRQVLKIGVLQNLEASLIKRDGTVFPAEMSGGVVKDSEGKSVAIVTITRDITAQTQMEQALRERETTIRTLLNASTDSVIMVDTNGVILALNETAAQRFDRKARDLVGEYSFNLLPPELAATRKTQVDRVIDTGEPLKFEDQRAGMWFESRIFPVFDEGNRVSGCAIVARDITDQKQAAAALTRRMEEFAELYQTSLEINAQLDLNTLLTAIVRRATNLLEAPMGALYLLDPDTDELELVVSHNLPADLTGTRLQLGEGISGQVAQTAEPKMVVNYSNWNKRAHIYDGISFGLVLGVPLRSGEHVFGVINVTDNKRSTAFSADDVRLVTLFADQASLAIQHVRRLEQTRQLAVLKERQRLARDLHDAVSQTLFSANIITDMTLRTWERLEPPEIQRNLEKLLTLTRGAQAEMRMLLLELRPEALVNTALPELLQHLGAATTSRTGYPVQVKIEGDHTLPTPVHLALYRIAQETLNNVVKHAQASLVEVFLYFQPKHVKLTIRDNGAGFDIDHIPDNRMGLRIMRERASEIGATLKVDTVPDAGTAVTLKWPVHLQEGT